MASILDRHRQRFAADATDRRAFEALEEAAFVAGAWAELIDVLRHRLGAPDLERNAGERARILQRIAQAEDRRGDRQAALRVWHSAVEADPRCRGALLELRRDATERERWDVALQIAEAELVLEMSSEERAELLSDVGALWLDHFDDAEQAWLHFERAVELLPRHAHALAGAARAAERLGNTQDAIAHWALLAQTQRGPARANALAGQARLLAGTPGGAQQAAELWQRALADDPGNLEALDALAEAAERDAAWARACELLGRRCELTRDAPERAEFAWRAGRIQLQELGDAEAARGWLELATQAAPERLEAWRALADALRELGDDDALRRALTELVDRDPEPASLTTLVELASLDSGAGDEASAARRLRGALELAPDDSLVIESLCDALARIGEWEELADCLERRAAIARSDPSSCAAAYADLAAVQEIQLGDLDAARRSYERALQAEPAHPAAMGALERIYRKDEQWQPLRTLLEHSSRSGLRAERPLHLCALGNLLAERFDDPEGAAQAYAAALALDHTCTPAHRGRQQLAELGDDPDSLLVAYENEASVTSDRSRLRFLVGELTRMHREREQPEAALAWTERWIAAEPQSVEALELACQLHRELDHDGPRIVALKRLDPLLQSGGQAALRRELGALHRAHARHAEAIAAYRGALEADPNDALSLEALVELLENSGRPEELARAHRALAELSEGEDRVRHLDAVARLLDERLGDAAQAIGVLQELADGPGAPDDVEERLETLLERTARYEELAERLARRAEHLEGEARRALTLRRATILLEHLSHFEAAVETYRGLVAEDPECQVARIGLERALRASGDPRSLASYLAEQAERHTDPIARDRCAFERAVILEEVLGAPEPAAEIFHALARGAAEPATAQRSADRLAELLERAEDYEALRAHLEEWLRRSEDEAQRAALHDRIGQLCRNRLADVDAAVEHFEAAVAIDAREGERWNVLARVYEEEDRPADLARALEGQLSAAPEMEPGQEQALRSRLGVLCATRLGESDRARDHYERVIELDPGDSAAGEFLVAYWDANARPDQVARLLELRLASLDAAPRDEHGHWAANRTSLRLRIAGLRASELDDPDGAIAVLEPALAEIGMQAAVAEPLADLFQRTGQLDELIALCSDAAEACPPGLERAAWLTRLGDALRTQQRKREAVDAYERALDERPGDTAIEAALRELYRGLGSNEPLARLLEAQLGRLGGPAEIPVRLELAKLWMGALGKPFEALRELRRVIQLEPGHAEALDKGLELAEHLDRPGVVRELLDAALRQSRAASVRASLLARRARLLAALDGEREAALADYREALSLEPHRTETRAALRELLEAGGDWAAALDCRCEEAFRADPEARIAHLERGAELAWERLSPDAALPWLERLRREQPERADVHRRIGEAHGRAGRWHAQLRAIDAECEVTRHERQRVALLCEKARLLENELGWPAAATQAYEQARELRPDSHDVLSALDRLYAAAGRQRARADVLEALAERAPAADRATRLRDAAELYAGPLADPRDAARLLLRALAETPRKSALYAELQRRLGDALRLAGPPDAWARCAEAELAGLDPAAEVFAERRLALRRELAAYYQRAGCLDAAIAHLSALVDAAPSNSDATALHEAALLHVLRCQGNTVALEQRLTQRLERTGGDSQAWLELARLRDEQLSATAQAAEAYRRAVALASDPGEALRGLRSAAERLARWDEVAATLELEIEHAAALAPPERAALMRRLGDVCWQRLGSTTRASRAYASAIEAWAEDFEAQRSLQRLLESMEDWRGALDLYESEIEGLGERAPERRQAAWLRAGELARDCTREPERALRAYVAAAELGPLAPDELRARAELHEQCGEHEAFAEVFASWCDACDARASAADHVRLAEALERLGDTEAARARCERALDAGAADAHALGTAARLREACGDAELAAEAWQATAACSANGEAGEAWRRAAALVAADDPERAAELLRKAASAAPASARVQCDLALVAFELESWPEAEAAATRALDACDETNAPDSATRLAVARIGARAARARGHLRSAAEFCAAALAIEPACAEALAGAGEALAALEEWASARAPLEARLAHAEADPDAARHHALLARCLAESQAEAQALAACEAALALDPTQRDAHELCVSLHEASDAIEPGVAALERWAQSSDAATAAHCLLRAARWELSDPTRVADAERHLREATQRDAALAPAWRTLAQLLWSQERAEQAAEAARAGLAANPDAENRAALALVHGRALEAAGDDREAAQAYGVAASADPGCIEAASAQARLLRRAGEWQAAADALARFAERHPGGDPVGLAEVLEQLGRLLAGPLEDLDGAIDAYRRALELQPQRRELRETLANLLSHRPDAWAEALAQYAATLDERPFDAPALRAALRIAHNLGNEAAVRNGLALLAALGVATPEEAESAPAALELGLARPDQLDSALGERLRAAVQCVAVELGRALGAPAQLPTPTPGADAIARFRAAALAAQADLTAPGLLPLPAEELADVVRCVALLSLDPDAVHASGATLNTIAEALGRRARKRVRRALGGTSAAEVESLDFAAWREELRALAAARAIDSGAADLRAALVARIADAEDRSAAEIGATRDLSAPVARCADAQAVLRRAVRAWLVQIAP